MGDRGGTGESHVARLFKLAPPMCSVHSRTGHGHALRLVRLAARQLTAVAQPLQGPLASARSCVPLRMRSITTGVSHLYRADPSSGYQALMLLRDACGCHDGSATRCTCSVVLSSLADSDPKARSALHTRKWVESTQFTSMASLGRIGDTAQSVQASDTSDCRYQHRAAMAAKFRSSPYKRIYLFVLLLIYFTAPT